MVLCAFLVPLTFTTSATSFVVSTHSSPTSCRLRGVSTATTGWAMATTHKRARGAGAVEDIEDEPRRLTDDYRRHQRDYHAFTLAEVGTVRRELLSWYDKNRRMLPWRGDPPPWTRTGDVTRQKVAAKSGKRTTKGSTGVSQPRLTAFFGGSSSSSSSNSSNTTTTTRNKGKKAGIVRHIVAENGDCKGSSQEASQSNASEAGGTDGERIPASAYGTWVSEIMLQQTRVETVVEYFVNWMKLFPTPKALAEADLEQINAAWAGLGYYRRAKLLHEGAKKVQDVHGGSLPSTAQELKELPGIGPYTAGAVASIAFGQCEPLVDGNVIRVLSRLKAIASDPKSASLNKLCWDLAGSLVDPDRPGDFNQALMELGATVCTVKSPMCSSCPLQDTCLARILTTETQATAAAVASPPHNLTGGIQKNKKKKKQSGESGSNEQGGSCGCDVCEIGEDGLVELPREVTEFPRKAAKTVVKEQLLSAAVVERVGRSGLQVFLVKRPDTGLLAGQWECPCLLLRDGSEKETEVELEEEEIERRVDSLLFSDLGLSPDALQNRQGVGTVVHIFSHLRHTMQVERVRMSNATSKTKDLDAPSSTKEIRWVNVKDMGGLGITTGMKKVLALAAKSRDHARDADGKTKSLKGYGSSVQERKDESPDSNDNGRNKQANRNGNGTGSAAGVGACSRLDEKSGTLEKDAIHAITRKDCAVDDENSVAAAGVGENDGSTLNSEVESAEDGRVGSSKRRPRRNGKPSAPVVVDCCDDEEEEMPMRAKRSRAARKVP